jgi:hypothetical protein
MFLIPHFIDYGEDAYLFFWADPRAEGCTLPVVEGVTLDGLPSDGEWTFHGAEVGESRPFVLAQSKRGSLWFWLLAPHNARFSFRPKLKTTLKKERCFVPSGHALRTLLPK